MFSKKKKKKKHQNTSVKNTEISKIVPGSLIPKVKITFFKTPKQVHRDRSMLTFKNG